MKTKLWNNKKGIGIGSLLIGLLLGGLMSGMLISYSKDINQAYGQKVDIGDIAKYDLSNKSNSLTEEFRNAITSKETDSSLSYFTLPLLAWSAAKTTITSAPNVLAFYITSLEKDLGLPDKTGQYIISMLVISLVIFIVGAVIRTSLE